MNQDDIYKYWPLAALALILVPDILNTHPSVSTPQLGSLGSQWNPTGYIGPGQNDHVGQNVPVSNPLPSPSTPTPSSIPPFVTGPNGLYFIDQAALDAYNTISAKAKEPFSPEMDYAANKVKGGNINPT